MWEGSCNLQSGKDVLRLVIVEEGVCCCEWCKEFQVQLPEKVRTEQSTSRRIMACLVRSPHASTIISHPTTSEPHCLMSSRSLRRLSEMASGIFRHLAP